MLHHQRVSYRSKQLIGGGRRKHRASYTARASLPRAPCGIVSNICAFVWLVSLDAREEGCEEGSVGSQAPDVDRGVFATRNNELRVARSGRADLTAPVQVASRLETRDETTGGDGVDTNTRVVRCHRHVLSGRAGIIGGTGGFGVRDAKLDGLDAGDLASLRALARCGRFDGHSVHMGERIVACEGEHRSSMGADTNDRSTGGEGDRCDDARYIADRLDTASGDVPQSELAVKPASDKKAVIGRMKINRRDDGRSGEGTQTVSTIRMPQFGGLIAAATEEKVVLAPRQVQDIASVASKDVDGGGLEDGSEFGCMSILVVAPSGRARSL